jgi:hypothetical protein
MLRITMRDDNCNYCWKIASQNQSMTSNLKSTHGTIHKDGSIRQSQLRKDWRKVGKNLLRCETSSKKLKIKRCKQIEMVVNRVTSVL